MAKRIRIFFINCPSLAVDAAAFLILAQNQVQSAIQFEIQHFWIFPDVNGHCKPKNLFDKITSYNQNGFHSFAQWWRPFPKLLEPLSRWLERRNRTRLDLCGAPQFKKEFKLKEVIANARKAIDDHDDWFEKCGYNRYDTRRDLAIIITETPLWGRYISYCGTDIAVLSAAKWEDFFRPAAGLEYVLTGVQRLTLRIAFGPGLGSHYPTRGCLWDFHVHQPDSKISSFLGFLCETCRANLQKNTSATEYGELVTLMENDWLGSESDPQSVAGILKKNYRYSMTRSTGLNPGVFDSVSEAMKSEFGKFLIEVFKWSLIVLITLFFLTYFPDVTKKWKELMSSSSESISTTKATPEATQSPTPTPELPIPASPAGHKDTFR